jgi:hypothetical protein
MVAAAHWAGWQSCRKWHDHILKILRKGYIILSLLNNLVTQSSHASSAIHCLGWRTNVRHAWRCMHLRLRPRHLWAICPVTRVTKLREQQHPTAQRNQPKSFATVLELVKLFIQPCNILQPPWRFCWRSEVLCAISTEFSQAAQLPSVSSVGHVGPRNVHCLHRQEFAPWQCATCGRDKGNFNFGTSMAERLLAALPVLPAGSK